MIILAASSERDQESCVVEALRQTGTCVQYSPLTVVPRVSFHPQSMDSALLTQLKTSCYE
jgi:hypothetical protein